MGRGVGCWVRSEEGGVWGEEWGVRSEERGVG